MLTVNDALADAPEAKSPSTAGVPAAVSFGVHFGPEVCVNVNPFSCVAYAVRTLRFVAVTVSMRISPVPAFVESANVIPYPGSRVGFTMPQYAGFACSPMSKGRG